MLKDKKIGFIGAGMMAEAITSGLIKAGVPRDNIRVSDPDENRRRIFQEQLGVAT
ncbi:MAG: pyrroline-5-carboxylate reductase family protein, partial [Armatimonadota bacterium]